VLTLMESQNMSDYGVMKMDGGVPIKLWNNGVQIEDEAIRQLDNVSKMKFIYKHLAVMPDCHLGVGATIGSVIPTKGAVIPSAVGVDIGCGMIGYKLPLTKSDLEGVDLANLRKMIETVVPHGGPGEVGCWPGKTVEELPETVQIALYDQDDKSLKYTYQGLKAPSSPLVWRQLGTLGGGNHFLELSLDESDSLWVVIHSGSRGAGNKIGTHFIKQAKEEMNRYHISLPDPALAFLAEGTALYRDYLEAVTWAQEYAEANRRLMLRHTVEVLNSAFNKELQGEDFCFIKAIECMHNYVALENHFGENVTVTRKGACRARVGDTVIVPGSMGAKTYIAEGLGNKESFNSCSHGAGRAMSRTQAKKQFSLADHELATKGIECRKDSEVLDETPGAYKDIDAVMEAQKSLVKPIHTLRQILCIKG
jgi:tRNA-splicing ligase RtcB